MNEAATIKELRRMSGASLLGCKKALQRCGGDVNLALAQLRERDDEPPEPEPEPVD